MKRTIVKLDVAVIPIAYSARLVAYLVQQGFDEGELLAGTTITHPMLANPDVLISIEQNQKLLKNIFQQAKNPLLGLAFGETLNLAAHGYLGFAVMTSQHFEEAIDIAIRYLKIQSPLISISKQVTDKWLIIQVDTALSLGEYDKFIIEAVFVSLNGIRKFLLGRDTPVGEIHFTFPEPPYRAAYQKEFQCPIEFNQRSNQFCISLEERDSTLPLTEPYSAQIARQVCEERLAKVDSRDDLIYTIRELLVKNLRETPTLDDIAYQLSTSPRTLRRYLAKYDTTYQKVMDNTRKDLAIYYLKHSQLPVEEIADILGFSDASNFGKAFKRWTGHSPRNYPL